MTNHSMFKKKQFRPSDDYLNAIRLTWCRCSAKRTFRCRSCLILTLATLFYCVYGSLDFVINFYLSNLSSIKTFCLSWVSGSIVSWLCLLCGYKKCFVILYAVDGWSRIQRHWTKQAASGEADWSFRSKCSHCDAGLCRINCEGIIIKNNVYRFTYSLFLVLILYAFS